MAVPADVTHRIDIKMALSGAKSIQNKIVSTMADIAKVRKEMSDLNIAGAFDNQLKALENKSTGLFNKLENDLKAYNDALKNIQNSSKNNNETPTVDTDIDIDALSKNLRDSYKEALPEVGKLTVEMDRLKQVSKSSIAVQKEEIANTLKLMGKYGISIRNVEEEYAKAAQKSEVANSATYLAKYNKELTTRAEKLIKIQDLLETINSLGLKSETAKQYTAQLQSIKNLLSDFSTPIKEAEIEFKNIKLNPKLIADMEEATKLAKDLGVDINKALSGAKDTASQQKLLELNKQLAKEQENLLKGGREEFQVAKSNISLIDERLKKYKLLTDQADRLLQSTNEDKNIEGEVALAVNAVVEKLRVAALEQFDLTKSSREQNEVLKESLAWEAKLNSSLKEKNALEAKLLTLQTKLESKLQEVVRVMNSKSQFATTDSLEQADKVAERLKKDIKQVNEEMSRVRGISIVDGNVDSVQLAKATDRVKELNAEFTKTSLKVQDVKAKLAELSSIKWGTNILKRAAAYTSMYAGIYEVIAVMKSGVEAVVEYDTQLRTIQSVFDVTGNTAKILADNLIALGRAWGGSITDINEAALALGRAGIATEKVAEATEIVIKMSKLTGDSIATSASAIITYQQVFGATHPVLKEIGDQLAYVANESRMSTQDIGTFSNYALAAASAAGLSMEAINALATSFSNAGVNASTIGTQIRRFSSLMKDNSTAAKEFFLKLGTTQSAFAAQMQRGKQSADEAMRWMANRLKSLSDKDFQKTIQGMDILASNSITLLRNNADEFLRHFQTLNAGVQGEIDKANLISDGYQASFEKMKVAAAEAFIEISAQAAPVIQDMIDSFAAFFDYIKEHKEGVVQALSAILDASKWAAMTASVWGAIKVISILSDKISGAAIGIGKFVLKITGMSEAFYGAAAAVRIFLATNPVGWAVLGVSAIGSVAYALYEYISANDDATAAEEKRKSIQNEIEAKEKEISANRRELGQLMQKLGDSTKYATQEEINRAAKLEYSIQQDERDIKVLREKQKLLELQGKIKLADRDIQVIDQKIKLSQDDNNFKVLGELTKQKERLEKDKIQITVEYSIAKSKQDYKAGVMDILNQYKGLEATLNTMQNNGVKGIGLQQRQKELDDLENKLKEIYGLDIHMFDGKNAEQEVAKFLNTLQGQFNAMDAELKLNVGLPDNIQTVLKNKMGDINNVLKNNKINVVDIMSDVDLNSFKKIGESIISQLKAGMDVGPQLDAQYQNFQIMFDKIKQSAAEIAISLNSELENSLNALSPENVDQKFLNLIDRLKQAESAFNTATSAKAAQSAMTEMNNVLAELDSKYKSVASTVVDNVSKITQEYDDQNKKVQSLTGELAKVSKAAYGDNANIVAKAEETRKQLEAILNTNNNIKMSYADIAKSMTGELDLTWQIKNANLSVKQADDLRIAAKQELVRLEAQLLKLLAESEKISATDMDEQQKANILNYLAGQMEDIIKKSTNMTKNLKVADSKYKTVTKSANSAAKAAAKHADEIKRARKELSRLEATYKDKLGDHNMSINLDISDDITKIEELGAKAGASSKKIQEIKDAYYQSKTNEANAGIMQSLSQSSGIQGTSMMMDYQRKNEELDRYYEERKAIIAQKEQEIAALEDSGGASESDVEDMKRQVELEKQQAYREEQLRIDTEYYTKLAVTVNAGLTDSFNTMKKLYDSGLVKSKGFARAMQAIQVAQAIMTTYQAAVDGYQLGLKAGGPYAGPELGAAYAAMAIAQGMANVAMIKAQKYHTGGYVDKPLSSGIGGKKDDEIDAVLQKGEYVLSKDEVSLIKAKSRSSQSQILTTTEQQDTNTSNSASVQTRELALLADSLKSEVVIVNSQDPAVIEDWATSRRGREVIQNVVSG